MRWCNYVDPQKEKNLKMEMMVDNYSSLFLTSWVLEMFYGVLPFDLMLKVWDFIFFSGLEFLFAVAIALLHRFEGITDTT